MEKPNMKYAVVPGYKPGTQIALLRPLIVQRSTYYINSAIEYALNAGYVRGQIDDMTGIVRGFFRACKELVDSGFAVNLADWIRIHPELTGSLDESRQLKPENNGIKVTLTPLSEMKKLNLSDFSWTSTEDTGTRVKVNGILKPNGTVGVVVKNGKILLVGNNLQWNQTYGDSMKVSYEGLSTPISLTPTEADQMHQLYDWPSALDELDDGTILEFKLTSRGGIEGAPDQVNTKYVVFHTA